MTNNNNKTPSIFNYDFDCYNSTEKVNDTTAKEKCCKKYKTKGEKKCKNCPKLVA